jgi:hypothetical protein
VSELQIALAHPFRYCPARHPSEDVSNDAPDRHRCPTAPNFVDRWRTNGAHAQPDHANVGDKSSTVTCLQRTMPLITDKPNASIGELEAELERRLGVFRRQVDDVARCLSGEHTAHMFDVESQGVAQRRIADEG